jgi:transcriptional regulator with XRE-family HTH domain
MEAQGLDVTSLARRCGLSRQGLYRILRADYRPLGKGFQSLARSLGVSPISLLEDHGDEADSSEVIELLDQSAAAEPRAFELLPAALHRICRGSAFDLGELPPLHHRLVAAAAEVASALTSSSPLRACARRHARRCESGQAFFFASRFMSPDRIVTDTPEPMKKHLVFGAFEMSSFARHLQP